jgi:hypothetical protein
VRRLVHSITCISDCSSDLSQGLCPFTQGCEERATLGKIVEFPFYPNGRDLGGVVDLTSGSPERWHGLLAPGLPDGLGRTRVALPTGMKAFFLALLAW